MVNLDNCRYVVWGWTHSSYHTHTHIHEAFYRALHRTGKRVLWLDETSDISKIDFSDTVFITEWSAALKGIPVRDDGFYFVHGLSDNPSSQEQFARIKNKISWNVYQDTSPVYRSLTGPQQSQVVWLAEECPYYRHLQHMEFRWATDILPDEIERNKPDHILGIRDSRTIWWVGTQWVVNSRELALFSDACWQDKVEFKAIGAGQRGVISIEENVQLVRQSMMAPAIVGSHHLAEGYAPCRIFKNISYGQMGITNSWRVHQLFGEGLIFDPDPFKIYFHARDRLRGMGEKDVKHLHYLMDLVATKHTYLNRIDCMMRAARIVMEGSR